MKKMMLVSILLLNTFIKIQAQFITDVKTNFDVLQASIIVDENDFALVHKSAILLQQDIEAVTGKKIPILHILNNGSKNNIIIGSITNCSFLKLLYPLKSALVSIKNKWEAYHIETIKNNLIIVGNDRRGVAFGVLELSKQIGVSP